ncbi:alpha/beta-hydrolase [Fomitiporia mediterranea MF3/22]|uniref:alpha/beta-hydrolase n=1 Tax=Fomitiporia mediterranea (strain MF3/22) TaxID=694068 RepID=UPI0004408CE4|nr:alpha/beta-hydrolase [Fomitiporia mediterranea MF3/22]EJD06840.1 alpha/beta-hydrolase [Fomitiporia mediterranea MF3/22]
MLPSALFSYFVGWLSTFVFLDKTSELETQNKRLTFHLRHLHAHQGSRVLFSDIPSSNEDLDSIAPPNDGYTLQTRSRTSHKPRSHSDFLEARRRSIRHAESAPILWNAEEIEAPDVEHRETLLTLAKMTYNAYIEPKDKDWYELGDKWTDNYPFGWEPDADGFRGYVFSTADNSTVVLSIKGTSASYFGGSGGPTAKKDKLNGDHNLLFSCCCAHVDWTWTEVCSCYRGGWNCDLNCLQGSLVEESLFYPLGTNIYYNLTYMYPNANIWIVGHSLGGALASLLGITFGVPVVAFESPGEKMASQRLHLPQPPSTQHVTHVYHTADPIAMGTCNGIFSSCALGGYAMESRCHLGESIIYDTISNLSWASDVRTHTIATVIEKLLSAPWAPAVEQGREVPAPEIDEDCVVSCCGIFVFVSMIADLLSCHCCPAGMLQMGIPRVCKRNTLDNFFYGTRTI